MAVWGLRGLWDHKWSPSNYPTHFFDALILWTPGFLSIDPRSRQPVAATDAFCTKLDAEGGEQIAAVVAVADEEKEKWRY